MASWYPGRDYYSGALGGSAVYGNGGGGIKRPVTEIERQQQLQQALFLRSVKQKTLQSSPVSPFSLVDLSVVYAEIPCPTSSSSSTLSFSQSLLRPATDLPALSAAPISTKPSAAMQNRLQELEKQLLDDEDDDELSASVGSAVTQTEWGDEMQQLLTPSPPPPPSAHSPTTSSSSTTSTASFSPSTTTISSRQLIADTATAMAEGNIELAASNIAILKRAANPRGDTEQRFTAYMVGALLYRMSPSPSIAHPAPELCSPEHFAATQILCDHSPIFKLCLSAANLAILDACKDYPRIHVVDFDVRNGSQYASLVQALAEHNHRANRRPPSLHITAICDPSFPFNTGGGAAGYLKMVGENLARLAEHVGVGLRFNIVPRRPAELDRSLLECEQGEALAVNLAFVLSRVADESVSPANPRDELLRTVKALGPTVVTLAEQELNTNTAPLAARTAEACAHYGALLESLDGAAAQDSRERATVEACLGRKAANAVGRDGAGRVERCEVYGKWRARMGMAGFKQYPLGQSVIEPVRSRLDSLRSARSQKGFTIKADSGALWLGWMGRPLTVASAWR